MRAPTRSRRMLALGAALLMAAGSAVAGTALGSPAHAAAAPVVSYLEGPFTDGSTATVSVVNAPANTLVHFAQCASGRKPKGPGDCGPSSKGASALATTDAQGRATVALTVAVGPLGNQTAPFSTCDATHRCDWYVIELATGHVYDTVRIPFVNVGPPSVGFLPEGPLRDDAAISVVANGFTPGATVAIAQCASGRAIEGPGDCGRSAAGALKLVTADGAGFARATLNVQYGHLNNATPPAVVCTQTHACVVDAINIDDVSQERQAHLAFSSAQVTPRVGIWLNKSKVKHGTKVTFTGVVTPYAADERVYLQRRENGTWKTKASALLGRSSTFSITWKPVSKTDYRWRVIIKKTPYHPAGASASKLLKVT